MKTKLELFLSIMMLSWVAPFAVAAEQHQHDAFPQFDMPVHEHENSWLSKAMLDRFERRFATHGDSTYWEAQAWYGGDEHKLWLKTEGSQSPGKTTEANLEIYYSRAVTAFWDAQVGLRHDFALATEPSRTWIGAGFQGIAPYLFEIDATAYVGDNNRTTARFKAEYDLLVTQRWVLMPEVEINAYGKEDAARNIGSGLSDSSLTLRLRYDIRRELSPYLGITWTQKYGGTADYAYAADEPVAQTHYVVGIKAWW